MATDFGISIDLARVGDVLTLMGVFKECPPLDGIIGKLELTLRDKPCVSLGMMVIALEKRIDYSILTPSGLKMKCS